MQAFGQSFDGVPATTDMHFRNGAVAFAYLSTLLMEFVDEHRVALDDTINKWMTLPEADTVTLKMLANQTSGYPDYETDPAWRAAFNADPFHVWTFQERLEYAFRRGVQFTPGTNWSYSHTNFMILGEILAKIGKKPLDTLLRDRVLEPMGLTNTTASATSRIPSPVLHAFSSERRVALGIPPTGAFYEEATYWNTQWVTPMGANETTSIDDMATTAVKFGTGALVSKSSYKAMTDPNLLGFGHTEDSCAGSCFPQTDIYNYGLGVVRSGSWLLQDAVAVRAERDRGVPPRREGRHCRGRDLRARGIRHARELRQRELHDLPAARCLHGTEGSAAHEGELNDPTVDPRILALHARRRTQPARGPTVHRRRRRHRGRARRREHSGAAVLDGAHHRRPVVDPLGPAPARRDAQRLPGLDDRRGEGRGAPPCAARDHRVPRSRLRARTRAVQRARARDDVVPRVPGGRGRRRADVPRGPAPRRRRRPRDHVGRRDPRRRPRRRARDRHRVR